MKITGKADIGYISDRHTISQANSKVKAITANIPVELTDSKAGQPTGKCLPIIRL